MIRIIADAGPLIAACLARDIQHRWAVRILQELRPPLLICEPVLTEVYWAIAYHNGDVEHIWEWLDQNILVLAFNAKDHYPDLHRLMRRYTDQKMDFADACVVRMSELHSHCRVFTCDSDFKVYRRLERHHIPLIFPD